jgi:hypothetical protein
LTSTELLITLGNSGDHTGDPPGDLKKGDPDHCRSGDLEKGDPDHFGSGDLDIGEADHCGSGDLENGDSDQGDLLSSEPDRNGSGDLRAKEPAEAEVPNTLKASGDEPVNTCDVLSLEGDMVPVPAVHKQAHSTGISRQALQQALKGPDGWQGIGIQRQIT